MQDAISLFEHYLELAKKPISLESFAGADVRFSIEYEALECELSKLHALHECGQVDWADVRQNSERVLRTQSKDLRIGAWLAWSLYQCESYPGLLAGLGFIHQLCKHQWEAVYPDRARARGAAISWLVPRLELALGSDVPLKEQLPLFRRLVEILGDLDVVCTHYLGHDAPLLLPIARRLNNLVQRTHDSQPKIDLAEAARAPARKTAGQLVPTNTTVSNERDANRALRNQQEMGATLCAWWLKQRATDPRPLRLSRTLVWLPINVVPECNAERITALRGLPADRLKSFADRQKQAAYADLVIEVETSLAKAPFWFDGQRMVWDCMRALNASQAMHEIEIHLAHFIERLPGVIDLRFHDGVPFADSETRAWISATVMPHLHTISTPRAPENPATQQSPWQSALEDVMPVIGKDGLKAAVQTLKKASASAQGGRERFHWRLTTARLCLQAKEYELARSLLESLDAELLGSNLSAWEPGLVLEVLQLLHGCCELLPQNHVVRERKEESYRRLCQLDLEVALEKA